MHRTHQRFVADWDRIRYLSAHIQALHQAVQEGADVRGYYAWSIPGDFEWQRGYAHRFGLVLQPRFGWQTIPS